MRTKSLTGYRRKAVDSPAERYSLHCVEGVRNFAGGISIRHHPCPSPAWLNMKNIIMFISAFSNSAYVFSPVGTLR